MIYLPKKINEAFKLNKDAKFTGLKQYYENIYRTTGN